MVNHPPITLEHLRKILFEANEEPPAAGRKLGPNRQRFARNAYIIREGEPARGIFCLRSGKAKILKRGPSGEERILKLLGAGDVLGWTSLINDAYCTSAIALERVTACFVPREELLLHVSTSYELSLDVMRLICREIDDIEGRFAGIAQKNARERLAEILIDLQAQYGTDDRQFLNILLSKKDLANFACMNSATMSRLLADFRRRRLIETESKRLRVLDAQKLAEIAGVHPPAGQVS